MDTRYSHTHTNALAHVPSSGKQKRRIKVSSEYIKLYESKLGQKKNDDEPSCVTSESKVMCMDNMFGVNTDT